MNTKNILKTSVSLALASAVAFSMTALVPETEISAFAENDYDYDYGRAWQQTLMFYEFQKSGRISEDDPDCNRNNWKGDCEWNDGSDVGLDLTGGWHDAGDHVKFNLPMEYASTMLAWSYLEYTDTYDEAGQSKYMLNEIKWVNDYLIKCHAEKNVFYYQVGDGEVDHQFWGAPELIDEPTVRELQMPKIERPSYYVTNEPEQGGSAVCAEAAASLTAASIAFKTIDPDYSALCLKHAKELYQMALDAQSDKGYMQHAEGFYTSNHFEDELSWAGAWLYKATGDREYLETAESYGHKWGGTQMTGNLKGNVWTQCWEDVRYGAMLLIAQLDDTEAGLEYKEGIEDNLDYWSCGTESGSRGKFSPKGLVMINDWGSVRYAASQAAMAMFYVNWDGADPERVENYTEFAKSQADYILGSTGRSYIVGYDETSPRNPHHRTADGPWKNSPLSAPLISRHTLVGAVVGGPDGDEFYDDDRNNYCTNEVANDYNAGALCLMAAMYDKYGGTIDPDMNANEEIGEEYLVQGCNYDKGQNHDGQSYCEVKLRIENHTAWPARPSENMKFRYFVNIKDALEQGAKPEDFQVMSYYTQRKSIISGLIPWNEEEGIYYTEISLGQDEATTKAYDKAGISYTLVGNDIAYMYPGGDVECRADMQLRIASPSGIKWDYTKNFSYVEIANTDENYKKIHNIPIYENDKLVSGIEPSKTGKVSLEIPDVKVTDVIIGTIPDEGAATQKINYSIKTGEKFTPTVSLYPSYATDKTLTWQSMNTNVATVDENGVITGVGKGSTSIIVWANGGGKPANLVVDVDGGVEDLYSAKVLGKTVDWTPPAVKKGEKVSNGKIPDSSSVTESSSKTESSSQNENSSSKAESSSRAENSSSKAESSSQAESSNINPTPAVNYGDVDENGSINTIDALKVLKHIVGLETLNEKQTTLADVDFDGEITSGDALVILKKIVGLIDSFSK